MVNPSAPSREVVYQVARPTKSLVKTDISGEAYCRTYDGPRAAAGDPRALLAVSSAGATTDDRFGRGQRSAQLKPRRDASGEDPSDRGTRRRDRDLAAWCQQMSPQKIR
jgi:hypothetical protein